MTKKTVLFLRDIPWDNPDAEYDLARLTLQDEGIEPVFLGEEKDGMPIPVTFLAGTVMPDIVLIDYGAMSIMGAHDGALSSVRYILRWAEDHASSAVIVWTQFTQFLVNEVFEAFGRDAPGNIFIYQAQTGRDEIWSSVRLYLGILEP